jgi:hypothetical protein
MKFRELLGDSFLQTPKPNIYKNDFLDYVKTNLKKFEEKVDSLDDDEQVTIPQIRYKPAYVKEIVGILVDGLLECLELYLDGKITEAYNKLDATLNHERKRFYELIKQFKIDTQTDFYRIRTSNDNTLFTPAELFHIPYELRGCVKNQRFSINGFPSLYLSSNLYTCWEELQRPNLSDFQAIRFRSMYELSVLDLTPPKISRITTRSHYRYLVTWPIIFACSIRVKSKNDIFKPEYIIPQLLLQWVRQNDDIDCIRYFSTNIDHYTSGSKGDFSNFVFPVKSNAKKGYCSDLKATFHHTSPISWQTYQMATGGQTFSYLSDEFEAIDNKIQHLEIIKNHSYPYSYSILGKLEHYLDNLETGEIEF